MSFPMFEVHLDEVDRQSNLFIKDEIKTEPLDDFQQLFQPELLASSCRQTEIPKLLKIHGYDCRLIDFHRYNRTTLTEEDVVAKLAKKYNVRIFERFLELCREIALRKSGKRMLRSNDAQMRWILNIVVRNDVSSPRKFRFQAYWELYKAESGELEGQFSMELN